MSLHRLLPLTVIPAILGALTSAARAQGSLTPPPGPPGPVMKTIQEVYDRAAAAESRTPVTAETCPGSATSVHVINQAGSYFLTGNVAGQSGKAAVQINAQGVTLDLNGFSLVAAAGATRGIVVSSGGGPVAIRNGFIRFWPQQGIQFTAASDFTIQDVTVLSSSGRGIDTLGSGTIERVNVHGARDYGIYCGGSPQVTLRECRVENVTGSGITMGIFAPDALVSRCTVTGVTGGAGGGGSVAGISAADGTVESCNVRNIVRNGSGARLAGIENANVVNDCTVRGITGNGPASPDSALEAAGIFACSTVSRCSVSTVNGGAGQYARGISLAGVVSHCEVNGLTGVLQKAGIAGVRISDCSVGRVTGGFGIEGSLVTGCTVSECDWGIHLVRGSALGESATATGNTIMECTSYGIFAGTKMAFISGNHVHGDLLTSGSAGIHVSGTFSSRIEGNHVTRWDVGIHAPDPGNIVLRNSSSANNTDFTIPAAMPVAAVTAIGSNAGANIYDP